MGIDSSEVLARLQVEPAPLSLAKLKKLFASKKSGNTEADLRAALASDKIFVWPKNSFWHIDPKAKLRADILAQCAVKALKKTEIKGSKNQPKNQLSKVVDELIAEKKLLKYPALAGTAFLLVPADSLQAYWAYVEEFVAAKLKKAGIAQTSLEENIWEILPKLEPEKDVPVSVARLRRALGLTEKDKERFDEAALKLREQRRVYLSQHDHPQALSPEDLGLLVDGKDGRFYVAITRREQ